MTPARRSGDAGPLPPTPRAARRWRTIRTAPRRDGAESVAADRITVVLLAVLRGGTLAQGVGETRGSAGLLHPTAAAVMLGALTAQSAAVFGIAGARMRRRVTPALDWRTAAVETVAGVVGLLVMAYATPDTPPPYLRTTSTFWIEPYTVISAVLIAAAVRRTRVGAAATICLAATYLLSVLVWEPPPKPLSTGARAIAVANTLTYLPFFAVGAIGFAVLRSIINQNNTLRLELGRLARERGRVKAATDAYDIGHNIPKGVLKHVSDGRLKSERLRSWAQQSRDDLVKALSGTEREAVSLRDELFAVATAFASAIELRVDLGDLGELPAGAPALLIVEAARELLNNASYHAYGYAATLTAGCSEGRVTVSVHNDGPGVDPIALASAWARKQNSMHTLQAAGGGYQIASSPGLLTGTTVTLNWPAAVA